MKQLASTHLLFLIFSFCSSAQPTYYYYNPYNAGVNNLYFNTGNSFKFLFIYTQADLSSAGINAPIEINSIWLKSNTAANLAIEDIKITLGHSSLSVPADTFAANFNAGNATVVLDENLFNYSVAAAPWNDPPVGWSEIPLTTPFTYNFSDNLAIQFEYSDINYAIPLYADNGGIPMTILTNVYGDLVANSSTARMMIGFSTSPPSTVAFAASDAAVCQKFCVDFTDLSINNPTAWQWSFEGGSPASSADQNPLNICYNLPGTYDVSLITTNASGSDTLLLTDYIVVYETPPSPSITQVGYTLTASYANSYQWQLNVVDIPGATSQSYEVLETGLYTVVVGDSNGCINSASTFVILTGMDDLSEAGINIYPNPSAGILTLEWLHPEINGDVSITLLNIPGQAVFSSLESRNAGTAPFKKDIDLRNLDNGVYFLNIQSEKFSMRKKIIISK